MKKRRLTVALLLGFSIFTSMQFYSLSTNRRMPRSMPPGEKESIGSSDDLESRLQYELRMLRDPQTGEIPANIREQELVYAATLPTRERVNALGKGEAIQTSAWSQRGPYNVGGRTRALAFDVSDATGNTLLAGAASGGMWRSSDGGSTWSRRTGPSDTVQSVTCLAQDTRAGKQNVWYYGTGEYLGNSANGGGSDAFYSGDGIYKSTDGGLTWSVLASTHTARPQLFENFFDYVWSVAVNPANPSQDEVYAATYGAIWRSTNGGASWSAVRGASPSPYSSYVDVAVTSTGVVYGTLSSGGRTKGIWRSPDGVTWTDITPSAWPVTYNRVVIGIAPSNEKVVYFLAQTPGSGIKDHSIWKYTYLSGDGSAGGGSWSDRSANIPAYGPPEGDFDSQGSYDLVIRVKPDDENVVFIGGTNLYRSTDGFATGSNSSWVGGYAKVNDVSSYANHHPDQHAITFMPANSSVLLSGNDGGISKTTNCLGSNVSWTRLDNGYYTTQTYTVAIDHGTPGNNIIVEGLQDNGVWFTNSTNAVSPWISLLTGDGTYCAVADGRTSYYVSSQNGTVYRMLLDDNGGPSKNPYFTKVSPAAASGFLFVSPFVLDPNNNKMMYFAAGNVIWRNSDLTAIPLGSNNPTTLNWDSLTVTYVSSAPVTALGVSKTPANRLYFGTAKGSVYRVDGANSGQPGTRTDVATGAGFPANAYVSCIAVDPTNADNAIVVFSNYNVLSLFSTSNGGSTWTAIGGNLEQNTDGSGSGPSCRWVTIVPSGTSRMYFAGTSTGLYSTSTLNGMSTVWAQEGASTIGNVVVSMVDARLSDGMVVAATHANGVFSSVAQPTSSGVVLAYDAGLPSSSVYEQLPNSGWILADRLTAPNRNVRIDKISYYYSGDHANGTGSFLPVVYASSVAQSGVPAPAALYVGASYTPSLGWNDIDISSQNLSLSSTTSAEFFVGARYNGTTEPKIGYTTASNGRAWEYDPTQSKWSQLDTQSPTFPATLFIRATITLLTGVAEVSNDVPRDFSLSQNYPNPFNPSTTIQFGLPAEVTVTLRVYDIEGRQIATLADGKQSPGTYSYRWNGKDDRGMNVSSGVYFYVLKAGNYSAAKKMVLTK